MWQAYFIHFVYLRYLSEHLPEHIWKFKWSYYGLNHKISVSILFTITYCNTVHTDPCYQLKSFTHLSHSEGDNQVVLSITLVWDWIYQHSSVLFHITKFSPKTDKISIWISIAESPLPTCLLTVLCCSDVYYSSTVAIWN